MSQITEENRKLIKRFKVETKEKNKILSIYRGDILKDESDLVGISVYDTAENKGDLYTIFRESISKTDEYKVERPFLKGEKVWTSVSLSEKNSRTILFVHSSIVEGEFINLDSLRSMLKITFATISSYIFEGNQVTSVALPVLFRKGIKKEEYTQYVQNFIFEASECLRKNNSLEEMKIYIWHEHEAEFWLEILNGRLTLSLEESLSNQQEKELRHDILTYIKKSEIRKLTGLSLTKDIERELEGNSINIFPLAREANKIVDLITKDLDNMLGMPHTGSPKERIFKIKSNRFFIEWFGDYLLSVKTFKEHAGGCSPTPLDNYHFLLQFAQILTYYHQIISTTGGVEYGNK